MAGTEITLDPPEFDDYNIDVDAEITFCLKELRVSTVNQDVHVYSINHDFDSIVIPMNSFVFYVGYSRLH